MNLIRVEEKILTSSIPRSKNPTDVYQNCSRTLPKANKNKKPIVTNFRFGCFLRPIKTSSFLSGPHKKNPRCSVVTTTDCGQLRKIKLNIRR